MKIFCSIVLLLCFGNVSLRAASKPKSTSTSRQFIVYGADRAVRGAICDLAERTKANLLHVLSLPDHWKTPLIINLDYPQANLPDLPAARFDFSQLGFGLKLQLNLLVTADLQGRALQRKLLHAILLELMYRNRTEVAAGTLYVAPPDWLLDGLLEMQPEQDAGANAKLLQAIVAAGKITPLEEFLRQRRRAQLDAPSRKLHDAYSMALLQLLVESPGGRRKLARLIGDLPIAPNDSLADLRAHFPETLGRAPAKWWALSVARLSATDRSEILSAAETANRLDRIVRLAIPDANGALENYSLGDYRLFRRLPAARPVLEKMGRELLLLSAVAHPSYRSIVQEDYALAALIARGKTRQIDARLTRVANFRQVVERQTRAIEDYLNWYEATQPKTISGAFQPVLEAAKMADQAQPRRRDPISVYLDSIEMETN